MRACPNCGQDIPETSSRCQNCGSPVGWQVATVPRPGDSVAGLAGMPDWPWLRAAPSEDPIEGTQIGDAPIEQTSEAITRLTGGHLTVRHLADTGSAEQEVAQVIELTGQDISIGRSPACDISLDSDLLVSRRQAMLYFSEDGYSVVDLGSSNGTLLNGQEVDAQTELRDGDRITVGHYVIEVSSAPASVSAPAFRIRTTVPLPGFPFDDTDPHHAVIDLDAQNGEAASRSATADVGMATPDTAEAPMTIVDSSGAAEEPQRNLGALEEQLTGMIQGLRQQAEADGRAAASFRRALIDVQQMLVASLNTQVNPASAGLALNVDRLAELARQTAQDPRHLDYILSLLDGADDLALVLASVQMLQAEGGVVAALHLMKTRIEAALANS